MDTNTYHEIFDKTCTDEYHTDVIEAADAAAILHAAFDTGRLVDDLKKAFAYGRRDTNQQELTEDKLAELGYYDQPIATGGRTIYDLPPKLVHSILGMFSESVELLEILLDYLLWDKRIDEVNLVEEFGDHNWYQNLGLKHLGVEFEETLERNIAKLAKRYPDKFNVEAAFNRDLEAEREVLSA